MIPTLLFPLFFFLFSFVIHGLALVSSNVEPNNYNSSTNSIPLFNGQNTTTTNTTKPYLTLLYQAPSNNPRHRRQPLSSRPMNTCRSSTATFMHSHCIHNPSMIGSMQSYLIFCRDESSFEATRTRKHHNQNNNNLVGWFRGGSGRQSSPTLTPPRLPRPTAEPGRCSSNEICINGQVPDGWGTSMAYCIGKDRFIRFSEGLEDGIRRAVEAGSEGRQMGGLVANAVFSDEGGRTPVLVGGMEIDMGWESDGLNSSLSTTPVVKTQTCRDCFELMAHPDIATDSLRADVSVMGTAAAAAVGILWLTVLSG